MFGGDGAEGGEHCSVDGKCVVQEFADDTLDAEDARFVDREGFSYFRELNAGAIVGFLVRMRSMFGFGAVVEEFGESGFYVAWHGKLYCAFHVVPG